MILSHPESNLNTNIMVLGAEIIEILVSSKYRNKYVLVDEIMSKFLTNDKNRNPDLFLYALTFLHIIGGVERKGYKVKLIKPEASNAAKQSKLFE